MTQIMFDQNPQFEPAILMTITIIVIIISSSRCSTYSYMETHQALKLQVPRVMPHKLKLFFTSGDVRDQKSICNHTNG